MLLTDEYVLPRELTGYARRALRDFPVNNPSLARFLPYNPIDDTDFRLERDASGLVKLAPFRTYDTEASIAGREGVIRQAGSLPPISRKKVLGEKDRLKRRANPGSAIDRQIEKDVDDLVAEVAMSFEFEIGDALTTGTVTPPGLSETVTFGRDALNSVTANVLWSVTVSSDPVADIRAWSKYYRQKNGVRPGVVLMSEDSYTYLLESVAIRTLAGNLAGTPTLVDDETLRRVFARNNLPPIEIYEVTYANSAGTATRIIPNNVALLLPAPVDPNSPEDTKLGATFIGAPAETEDPRYDLADSAAGIVAGNYTQDDPYATWTKVSAIGLATLANPDMSFKAVVA